MALVQDGRPSVGRLVERRVLVCKWGSGGGTVLESVSAACPRTFAAWWFRVQAQCTCWTKWRVVASCHVMSCHVGSFSRISSLLRSCRVAPRSCRT